AVEDVGARLTSLGLFELLVPPAHGGRAFGGDDRKNTVDVRALCLAREALAYRSPLADGVFAVQGLGSYPIVLSGQATARAALLRDVIDGTSIGGFALTEPEAGSDVGSMRTTARKDAEGWVLDGEKVFISNVGIAKHYVVFANADPA